MARISVPGCEKTFVETLHEGRGAQVLLVEVGVGGEVPVHRHDCAATMVVLQGDALAVGEDSRRVFKGDVIVKDANDPHGFSDVRSPFVFVSISDGDGIKQHDGWDIQFEEAAR